VVKLVDFGVHTIRDRRADERTAVGVLRGTLSFMSPEQADGREVDRRSDVFSLGSVLYEALTGQRLFRAPSDLETLRRVREAVVAPPSTHRRDIDPRLDPILLAMLARSPLERWASCDEVARALRPFAQEAGVDATWVRELLGSLDLEGGETIRKHRAATDPAADAARRAGTRGCGCGRRCSPRRSRRPTRSRRAMPRAHRSPLDAAAPR